MRMNPGIIMAGQQPDFVNTLAQSTQAARMQGQAQQENALRQLYQTQGPGIMAGEDGALNALSQIDPMAAFGVRDKMQDNEMRRGNYDMRRQEFELQAQEYKRKVGAEQAAREAQEFESHLARLSAIQDPAQYDAYVATIADPEDRALLEGSFGNLEPIIRQSLPLIEALKRDEVKVEKPQTDIGKLRSDFEKGFISQSEFEAKANKILAPTGERISMTPDGGFEIVRGGAAGNPSFTEGQGKDNVYSTRARGALEVLESENQEGGRLADTLVSRGEKIAGAVPLGLGREFQSDDYQVAEQAGLEFLQAILRKDTGAAITQDEVESYGRTYLPQPGDSPSVLETKRQARIRAINALESGMSAQQMLARDRALIRAADEAEQANNQSAQDFSSMGAEELSRVDVMSLTEEELDAFEAAMQALRGGQ